MPKHEPWNIFQQTRALFKKKAAISPFDLGGWSMFQQTRPLYVKPLPLPPPPPSPPILYWPRIIYCATKARGVFYTNNFDGPTQQPYWNAINDGLATLDCKEFHLDPFDEIGRQFVAVQTGANLYMRENGGAWVNICNATTRGDLTGDYGIVNVGGFCLDPTIQGRIWMTCWSASCEYSFVSDDYGATWQAGWIYCGSYPDLSTIRAHGDLAWTADDAGVGTYGYMLWTINKGVTWRWQVVDLIGLPEVEYNPLCSTYTYYGTPEYGTDLCMFQNAGNYHILLQDPCMSKPGAMWFNPNNINHQRVVWNDKLYITYDGWVTANAAGTIIAEYNILNRPDEIIAPWSGDNTDRIFISSDGAHVISALYGEADLSATGIGGQMTTAPPYTFSIPQLIVSGGVCNCGIQCPREAGYVYQ